MLGTGTFGGIPLWLPRRVNNDPSVVDDDDFMLLHIVAHYVALCSVLQ